MIEKLKHAISEWIDIWKYDRELSRCYRLANKRIKEAQQRAKAFGYVYYVLADKKGDFFCFNSKEREFMVKNHILPSTIDGAYCIKHAIFIARPLGNHTKRIFTPTKEWMRKT